MTNAYVLGGGTFNYVRAHLSLAAPAFGKTARDIDHLLRTAITNSDEPMDFFPLLCLTKMADHESSIVTNDDVAKLVNDIIADKDAKLVFFNVALCDYTGEIVDTVGQPQPGVESGKYSTRLKTVEGSQLMEITPSEKLLKKIRTGRKDIFLVAFKTTAGATSGEQYLAGLNLLKANHVNLVLANDIVTRNNMIIVPEEARYCETTNRTEVITELVSMARKRSKLHFTRSTVVEGESIDWNGSEVPNSLRTVVNHCIQRGAYKPFRGSTAGHFAYKVDKTTFITSKRKVNYNNLDKVGLVKVEAIDDDTVIAYGAKPSVGGQSQRIVFAEHPDVDCIVHFHCPMADGAPVPVRPQKDLECGSHECGANTSHGLEIMEDGIKAVFLDNHGPNIVFNRNVDPSRVINFIERNFMLDQKTGGLVA